MSTKKLTCRQARQALDLANYNFEIVYRLGKQNAKADALTRKPGDRLEEEEDKRQKFQFQTILGPDRLSPSLRKELEIEALRDERQSITLAPILAETEQEDINNSQELATLLELRVFEAQKTDETCQRIIKKLREGERIDKEVQLGLC